MNLSGRFLRQNNEKEMALVCFALSSYFLTHTVQLQLFLSFSLFLSLFIYLSLSPFASVFDRNCTFQIEYSKPEGPCIDWLRQVWTSLWLENFVMCYKVGRKLKGREKTTM